MDVQVLLSLIGQYGGAASTTAVVVVAFLIKGIHHRLDKLNGSVAETKRDHLDVVQRVAKLEGGLICCPALKQD